jgi:photosystem II stability/assembly factor-like uncharacterized protein
MEFCKSENYVFAGLGSKVLRKLPDSTTWNITEMNMEQYFTVFGDDSNNMYATSGSRVFISTNEGNSWIQQNTGGFFSNEYMYRAIFNSRLIGSFQDETGWFGVGWGAAVSNNQGLTWQWAQTGLPPKLSGFKLAKSGTDTYLSTNAAGVYLSTDFGGSWSPHNNGLNSAVVSKVIIDVDETLYATCWGNGIYKSTDDGNTWIMINNGLNNVYMMSIVLDDNGHFIAGSEKGIFRSTDKGESWQSTTSAGNNFPYHLYKDKQNRIYALTYGTGIYRTSNLGVSWSKIDQGFATQHLLGFAIDSTGGIYAGGIGGRIYKTTNDGLSWTEVYRSSISSAIVAGISVAPDGNVYASVRDIGAIRSTDKGYSWEVINNGLTSTKVRKIETYGDNIFITFYHEGIFLSNDQGESWFRVSGNMINVEIRDITFDKKGNLYLSTHESVWKGLADDIPVELYLLYAAISGSGVELQWSTATEMNNRGFEIERKQDNTEWEVLGFIPGSGTTAEKKEYSFIDENITAGKYNYRLKQIDYDGSFEYSNVLEITFDRVYEYALAQNYPNPFNPYTTIKYSLPRQGRVTIIIYDALGREIVKLIDQEKPAGEYSIEFNASGLPSGVYVYRMQADGFTQSRKLLYMK